MNGIKYITVPICKNCIHYRPSIFASVFGKCSQYGRKNIVSGVLNNDYADIARYDNSKCGIDGKLFIKERETTIFLRNNVCSLSFLGGLCALYGLIILY